MCFSVGSLMAAMWNRYNIAIAIQDHSVFEISEEFGGTSNFIKSVGDAADAVNNYFEEWFNNCDYDWKMINIDANGEKEDSLDAAIWAAICGRRDVIEAAQNWIRRFTQQVP